MDTPTRRVARAPLRISFAGGGTDLPAYAERYGGMVVSAAITLHVTVGTTDLPTRDCAILDACQTEALDRGWSVRPQSLAVACDAPPGTGLGSSSATAVACLAALRGTADDPALLAQAACAVEIDRLAAPIGRQDQYASAFGGINTITFTPDGAVTVTPLRMPDAVQETLANRLLLFRDGTSRTAGTILSAQQELIRHDRQTRMRMHAIRKLAEDARDALETGDLDAFATVLDLSWRVKRRIASVTTPAIDAAYQAACAAGAAGGKLCGAGGGGHLLCYAHADRHVAVCAALMAHGLTRVPFGFDLAGVRLIEEGAL